MSGRRKHECVDGALVRKIQKLRNQGLTYQIISERLGMNPRHIERIALKSIKK